MPIVQNFVDLSTPDVFLREAEPAASIRGGSIGVVGIVIQAIRGPVSETTLVSDLSDFVRKFGGYDRNLPEGYMFAYNLFKQGASAVKVVRVTGGSHVAATGEIATGNQFRVKTPGTWGNAVTVSTTANAVAGFYDLVFAYGSESYTYKQVNFGTANVNSDRYFKTVIQNSPDDFVEVIAEGTSATATTGTVTFSQGSNGVVPTDANYVTAIAVFEADDTINFVCSPNNTSTVNSALKDHAELRTVTPRIAIIAPPSGTTVAGLVTIMASYNSDKVVVTYPYLQILNPNNNRKEYHSPTAFYAGVLSTLSYEQSPSRKQVLGIIGTERALTRAEVDTLSQNRVSPITLLNGQGFVIRNGFTASANPAKANITRRRAANFFAMAFERGSQQFVSRPHTVALRNDVKSAYGSLIENELLLGRIGNVNGGKAYAVKCDGQNNPDSVVRANRMIVDVQISLLAPADFILVTLDASEAKVVTLE